MIFEVKSVQVEVESRCRTLTQIPPARDSAPPALDSAPPAHLSSIAHSTKKLSRTTTSATHEAAIGSLIPSNHYRPCGSMVEYHFPVVKVLGSSPSRVENFSFAAFCLGAVCCLGIRCWALFLFTWEAKRNQPPPSPRQETKKGNDLGQVSGQCGLCGSNTRPSD